MPFLLICSLSPKSFLMKSYHFFLKDHFDTGMGTVGTAVRTVYGSLYRWGSEGGFGGVRTSTYQYVQGKTVFSRGGP
jgi:hypothetical protein